MKKENETLPLIKSWRDVATIIKLAIDMGVDGKGKDIAKQELGRMADVADIGNEAIEHLARLTDPSLDRETSIKEQEEAREFLSRVRVFKNKAQTVADWKKG